MVWSPFTGDVHNVQKLVHMDLYRPLSCFCVHTLLSSSILNGSVVGVTAGAVGFISIVYCHPPFRSFVVLFIFNLV